MSDQGKWWDGSKHTTLPSAEAKREIARRLKAAREAMGLKSADAARLLGRVPSAYSDIERNGAMSLGSILQAAEAFGVSPAALLPSDGDESAEYKRGFRHGYLSAIEKLQEDIPQ